MTRALACVAPGVSRNFVSVASRSASIRSLHFRGVLVVRRRRRHELLDGRARGELQLLQRRVRGLPSPDLPLLPDWATRSSIGTIGASSSTGSRPRLKPARRRARRRPRRRPWPPRARATRPRRAPEIMGCASGPHTHLQDQARAAGSAPRPRPPPLVIARAGPPAHEPRQGIQNVVVGRERVARLERGLDDGGRGLGVREPQGQNGNGSRARASAAATRSRYLALPDVHAASARKAAASPASRPPLAIGRSPRGRRSARRPSRRRPGRPPSPRPEARPVARPPPARRAFQRQPRPSGRACFEMRPPRRRRSRRPGPAPAPSRVAQTPSRPASCRPSARRRCATGLSCRVKATVAGRVVVRGARYAFGGGDRASASINRAWSSARASAASAALRFTLENFCAPSRSDRCTDTPAVVWGRATAPPAAAQSPRLSQRGS